MGASAPWYAGPHGPTLAELLDAGRREGAFPEAAGWVSVDGRVVAEAQVGALPPGLHPRARRFDLASLTKPRVTVSLAMRAVSAGSLDLDAPIDPTLPPHLSARALLSHRGGLAPWKDWARALPPPFSPGSPRTRFALEALLRQAAFESDPAQGVCYSDIGFLLLQRRLESIFGRSLRALVRGFRGPHPGAGRERFAPCGPCPYRGRILRGEVHDPQAWVLGGAAGHAGLFGTAAEVGRWASALVELARTRLKAPSDGPLQGIDGGVVRDFWAYRGPGPGEGLDGRPTWTLGWDRPSRGASSAGQTAAPDAIGHLGFTGTSVWLEPSRRLVMVLLTNRVALGPEAQPRLRAFRPLYHDALRRALGV